jgi:hypothetical protein
MKKSVLLLMLTFLYTLFANDTRITGLTKAAFQTISDVEFKNYFKDIVKKVLKNNPQSKEDYISKIKAETASNDNNYCNQQTSREECYVCANSHDSKLSKNCQLAVDVNNYITNAWFNCTFGCCSEHADGVGVYGPGTSVWTRGQCLSNAYQEAGNSLCSGYKKTIPANTFMDVLTRFDEIPDWEWDSDKGCPYNCC